MSLVLPREEEVENMFSRILSSDQYCERLMDAFYDHLCDDKATGCCARRAGSMPR